MVFVGMMRRLVLELELVGMRSRRVLQKGETRRRRAVAVVVVGRRTSQPFPTPTSRLFPFLLLRPHHHHVALLLQLRALPQPHAEEVVVPMLV